MRLFVAIELDTATRALIAGEQRRLAAAMGEAASAIRFVRAEQLHLTLVFLGDRDAAAAGTIQRGMTAPLDERHFVIGFGGVGAFPAHGPPRVVWLGVSPGGAACVTLQAAVEARLAQVGVEPERRPFTPHLTLGRWSAGRSVAACPTGVPSPWPRWRSPR